MPRNYFATTTDLLWDVNKTDIIVNGIIAPDNYALVRSDNNKILEIHKESYNPFYNLEFRSLMDDLQKITGFENLSYNEFKGGNVVLGYLENNSKENIQVNGFDVNKYLVLGNSHDGSKGIFLGTSEVMLRCMNQFGAILKSNVVRHTKNNFSRIEDLKRAYEVYFTQTEKVTEIYAKMNKISIDPILIDLVTRRMFDLENKEEQLSTRKENQLNEFYQSIATETKDLGNNLFGLFHGVTHYTTHKLKGENVVGNLFGTASKMNTKGYEAIAELVS